ncbi:MAG: SurA N-terminal domain-containing protein [Acidobacteriia bacterium]|nr:SurA N-terminal domain-containing protein [Terriglobia bacterium]
MMTRALQFVLLLLVSAACSAQIVDRMVAVVNGRVILQSELDQEVRVEFMMQGAPLAKRTPQDTLAALDRLIDRALLDQQIMNTAMVDPAPEQVAEQVKSVRAQVPGAATDEGWKKLLQDYGLIRQDIEDYVTSQVRLLSFIDLRFRGLVRVDKVAITTYYQEKFLPELRKQGHPEQPLADVSGQIEKLLVDQNINEMLNTWLQTLRSQARIEKMVAAISAASGEASGVNQ